MGATFRWFNDVTIIDDSIYDFIEGDCTSHGYGNTCDICDLFKTETNIQIPNLNYSYRYKDKSELELIEPKDMIKACEKLLKIDNNEIIEKFRDRIEWFKELSEQGFYIAYTS
ncbi:MAG: hypothetical protein NC310_09070 [Roseburia sp.]|nr:hypothetical protein [Roseburia sp.]